MFLPSTWDVGGHGGHSTGMQFEDSMSVWPKEGYQTYAMLQKAASDLEFHKHILSGKRLQFAIGNGL